MLNVLPCTQEQTQPPPDATLKFKNLINQGFMPQQNLYQSVPYLLQNQLPFMSLPWILPQVMPPQPQIHLNPTLQQWH